MWILFTTNNAPDVFLPAYETNRMYFFFFFAYLVLMVYLLANILLAKVYDAYKELLQADLRTFVEHQHICIQHAFDLLADGRSYMMVETWREFFVEYCDPAIGGVQVEDPDDTQYNTWRANLILSVFHGIDLEQVQGISSDQFRSIMEIFVDQEIYIPKRRPPTKALQQTQLHDLHKNGITVGSVVVSWDTMVDLIIVPGTIVSFLQAYSFCQRENFMTSPTFWILFAFSLIYASCISVTISLQGFERFWNKKIIQHRFDFVNIWSLIVAELLYFFVFRGIVLQKAIVLLGMARMFRLIKYIKPLQRLFFMIKRLLPTYLTVFRLLLVVYFVFACVGQLAFGGLIYNTQPKLLGTGFAQTHYFTMNFNDTSSSLVTLFVLMILNNWTFICQGFVDVTGSNYTSLFFVSFFVVCNLIVLNILMALVLECMTVMAQNLEEEELHSHKLGANIEQMASGAGERSATYMLRAVLCSDDHHDDDNQKKDHHDAGKKHDSSASESDNGGADSGYGTMSHSSTMRAPAAPKSAKKRSSKTTDDFDLRSHAPPLGLAPTRTTDDLVRSAEHAELTDAVTKLQASFRGWKTRKTRKEDQEGAGLAPPKEIKRSTSKSSV